MTPKKGLYSLEETTYIKNHYFYETVPQIAKALNRNISSVQAKIGRMKLYKNTFALPEELQQEIKRRAETTTFNLKQLADEFQLSPYRISKILKRLGVKRKRYGWHKTRDLLKDFHYHGNSHATRSRAQFLWAYKNTCWDCKKTLLPNELAVHHDWASLPIKVYVLCKDCHKKRHGVKNRQIA